MSLGGRSCKTRTYKGQVPNQHGQAVGAWGWKCETHEVNECCYERRGDAVKGMRLHKRNAPTPRVG